MEVIEQKLELKKWPLVNVGDKKFFGYIVSMGVIPMDWVNGDMVLYADFAYSDSYERYVLPNDKALREDLLDFLWDNIQGAGAELGMYNKLWIELTVDGFDAS